MIGLLYLVFFLIYGGLTYMVVRTVARWARSSQKSPLLMGGLAGILMLSPVFWDWPPMEVMFQYDCASRAGFTQYQTLDQWKVANPGVAATLTPSNDLHSTRKGNRERYVLNQRFAWDIIYTKHPLHIVEREERIVDTKTGEVLARYVDFSTDILGVSVGSSARGLFDYKVWMMKRSCEKDGHKVNRGHFFDFESVFEKLGGSK